MGSSTSTERVIAVFNYFVEKLEMYEKKFAMSSDDFYDAFQRGTLPEQPEYFDWRLVYTGYLYLQKRFDLER